MSGPAPGACSTPRTPTSWSDSDRPFHWAYPLVYPFTAIVVGLPFAMAPLTIANALFSAAGAGLMAWGLTRERLHDPRLLVFLSLPFFHAALVSQWSPLLVGAALVPASAGC